MSKLTENSTAQIRLPVAPKASFDALKAAGAVGYDQDSLTIAICPEDNHDYRRMLVHPSDLPAAGTLSGNERVAIVQGGVMKFTLTSALGAGGGAAEALGDLSDVVLTDPADGDVLTFIGGQWINKGTVHDLPTFLRGDVVWQQDPGGLWDTGKCFVHLFPLQGKREVLYIDFLFGAVGSGSDGSWGVWGGIEATGTWTLLDQGDLPNTSKGTVRGSFAIPLDVSAYDIVALAQDPGASGVSQPIRQAAMYYSPNPPVGIPAAYSYLGNHVHGSTYTTLPGISAPDVIYLMQKWSSIGVR